MATFVYAPAIRVHVETENHGILDISDDITNWELIRRSNAPSSFNFQIQNPQRKYDRVFRPSDRITVELKRIVWVRVFTGSLNNVPIWSSWPRAFAMSATCSLKKLQFWSWDPTTTTSANMVATFMAQLQSNSTKGDMGLSGLITESLTRVTNWDQSAIHIGAVPNAWFGWAKDTEKLIDAESSMATILGSSASIGGVSIPTNLHIPPGTYGGANLNDEEISNIVQVYATVLRESGLSSPDDQDHAALITLMVCGAEASYYNRDISTDHDSVGMFQQRASYGSVQERTNIPWATMAFVKGVPATGDDGSTKGAHITGLLDLGNWRTNPDPAMVAQNVQRSFDATGSNYRAWQGTAQALVTKLRQAIGTAVSNNSRSNPIDPSIPTGQDPHRSTGDVLAKVAYDLVTTRAAGTIWYSQTQASDPRDDNPRYLDCSQLVRWCIYHATGQVWSPRSTSEQWPALQTKGIPYEIAKHIRGCLMYGSGSGSGTFPVDGTPEHTGISLGNGQHVAAHEVTEGHLHDVDISDLPGGLYWGALAPGVDYTAAATSQDAVDWLQRKLNVRCSLSTATGLGSISDPSQSGSGYGQGTDPFAQLVSALTMAPEVNGDIFGGPRQLMNNQFFLPWVGNLTNSTMRAYCSAPNGDFIAWFPDYFNVWGTAAIMDIKLIELQDFTVEWSDQEIVTHEFVLGSVKPTFSGTSGQILDGGTADYQGLYAMLATEGIATMDFPAIFKTIYGKPASNAFVRNYIRRFGARPNVEQFPNIMHGPQEFYMALWQFMRHWASQFNATVPMTFMPELWPGMIMRIQEYGFQAYVTEVTHRGSYGKDGRFTTEAKIIAPAPIDEKTRGSLFGMLDVFK